MFDEFEQALRDMLVHLYDPVYRPTSLLCQVLGCHADADVTTIQATMLQAIVQFKPPAATPPSARVRRLYDLLSCRYVQELTQEETAERLGMSVRHLRREQQQAVHILAQWLWERRAGGAVLPTLPRQDSHVEAVTAQGSDSGSAWRSQVRQEVASLQQSDPGAVADVQEVIQHVYAIERKMAQRLGIHIAVDVDEQKVLATIHPSLLRQFLIIAIQKLIQHMSGGEIRLNAHSAQGEVIIQVAGQPLAQTVQPDSRFIRETVTLLGGRVDVRRDRDCVSFWITLPLERQVVVLMVDDNSDLVHVFRRFTDRTRYQLAHVDQGRATFAAIAQVQPDVVVLDVMLPDMDGWEILTRLHEDPATRSIPVIVCSVIHQEELARALGAADYVSKPVSRAVFLQVLDRVLTEASGVAPPDPA